MIDCKKYSRFFLVGTSILLVPLVLSGCTATSTPSRGKQMMASSVEAGDIARRWNAGESMVKEGDKLVSDGKKQVMEGEKMISKGRSRIADGERDVKRGMKLMGQGHSKMAEAEHEYSEKYPDLYRRFQPKR